MSAPKIFHLCQLSIKFQEMIFDDESRGTSQEGSPSVWRNIEGSTSVRFKKGMGQEGLIFLHNQFVTSRFPLLDRGHLREKEEEEDVISGRERKES